MKVCMCRAISPNLEELRSLENDLRGLGLNPTQVGRELTVTFHEMMLMPHVLEMFEQFEEHSFFVEF